MAQSGPVEIALSPAEPDGLPKGFVAARTGQGAPAAWAVVDDPTATSGHALAQVSTDTTDYRFPLAIYQDAVVADVEVSVHFKAVAGTVDRAGGLVARCLDPDNYYVVRANALEDNVNFYRVVRGRRQQIQGASVKVTSDAWHTLALRADGDRFAVSFDGAELFVARDQSFAGAGKIGLWTKADSVTRFTSLTLWTLR